MNRKRRRFLWMPLVFILAALAAFVMFFVSRCAKGSASEQKNETGTVSPSASELKILLPLDWFVGDQAERLSIHLDDVKTVVRNGDGFEVVLEGTASLAQNAETYAIEMRLLIESDGDGYYVSDIISCYCNGNHDVHNEFEMVKRDCLSFMERSLLAP